MNVLGYIVDYIIFLDFVYIVQNNGQADKMHAIDWWLMQHCGIFQIYIVMLSFIGLVHTQNNPCTW